MGSGGGCRSRARSPSRTLAVADADAVPHGEGPGRAAQPSRLRDLDPKKIGGGARRYGGGAWRPLLPAVLRAARRGLSGCRPCISGHWAGRSSQLPCPLPSRPPPPRAPLPPAALSLPTHCLLQSDKAAEEEEGSGKEGEGRRARVSSCWLLLVVFLSSLADAPPRHAVAMVSAGHAYLQWVYGQPTWRWWGG